MQHREQRERQRERDCVQHDDGGTPREPNEHGTQQRGQCDFAQSAEAEARERDADLHAGDHAIQLTRQTLDDFGARAAFSHKLTHARQSHRDQRKFRGGEKAVHDDERENGE